METDRYMLPAILQNGGARSSPQDPLHHSSSQSSLFEVRDRPPVKSGPMGLLCFSVFGQLGTVQTGFRKVHAREGPRDLQEPLHVLGLCWRVDLAHEELQRFSSQASSVITNTLPLWPAKLKGHRQIWLMTYIPVSVSACGSAKV